MELKQIRHFLSVAETLNFTQASEQNDISQPALTKSIQKLEEEFGGLLIVRDGKNTRLTELGQKVRSEFSDILESEARAKLLAHDHLESGHSMLNIGIADSLGPSKFAEFLARYLAENPNTRIVLHQIDQSTSQEAILSGFLDACICTQRATENHKIKTTPIFEERLLMAFAKNDDFARKPEIGLDEFSKQNYFDRLNCEFRTGFLEMVDREDLDIRPLVQSDREDWIQQLVAAGKGICTLGEFSAVVPGIRMRPIKGVDMKRTVAISFVFGSAASSSIVALEKLAQSYDWNC
ncbi:MAG: LysR family transcriptional regulator [Parasphingorhabdus sp.]